MSKNYLFFFILFSAFQGSGQFWKESTVIGSFESNSHYYTKDSKINFLLPSPPYATNNYLKINALWKFFEAGIQYENYLPPLIGYSQILKGHRVSQRYLTFRSDKFRITAGHFFEQYGNGLILRTYEDRALGINTALDGLNFQWNTLDFFSVKVFGAKQLGYKRNGTSFISGSNLNLHISELVFKGKNIDLNTGLSLVYMNGNDQTGKIKDVSAISGELNFGIGNFGVLAEVVSKSNDPSFFNGTGSNGGLALIVSPSFSKSGFGVNTIFRRLKSMDFRSDLTQDQFFMLNFIPANTRQHKYSLANLFPYAAQPSNEFSQQFDAWFVIPKYTRLGGLFGTKVAINYSGQFAQPGGNDYNFQSLMKAKNNLYSDFNIELDRKWIARLKTVISYIFLNLENYYLVPDYEPQKMHIGVADVMVKINPDKSINFDVQHLWADTNSNNWIAISAEYNFSQKWTLFFSDMTNYTSQKMHYPNGGIQFNYKSTNISFNYGRNREGFRCSGGICRWMPAYSGLGFSVSTGF